jgi:hypothetical protein
MIDLLIFILLLAIISLKFPEIKNNRENDESFKILHSPPLEFFLKLD